MALTPAEKQAAYRARRKVIEESRPDAIEEALLADVERAERGKLSIEERAALANKLADAAMQHQWRAMKLAQMAQKVRSRLESSGRSGMTYRLLDSTSSP
jgi:hypothetical protein